MPTATSGPLSCARRLPSSISPLRAVRVCFFVLPVVRSISRSCAPHESAADGQAMRRAESHVSLGGSSVGSCHSSHTNGDGHQRSERSDSAILADLLSRDTHACMHACMHARACTHAHTHHRSDSDILVSEYHKVPIHVRAVAEAWELPREEVQLVALISTSQGNQVCVYVCMCVYVCVCMCACILLLV